MAQPIPPNPNGTQDCTKGPSFPANAGNLCTSATTPLQLTVTCVNKITGKPAKNCKGGDYQQASTIYAGSSITANPPKAPTGPTYVLGDKNNSNLKVVTTNSTTGQVVGDVNKFAPACTKACPAEGVWLANWATATK